MRSLLIAAAALGLVYFLVTPSMVQLPPPGDYGQAKPLSAPDLSGETVSLEDYRDKVVLVQVWATWCPYCRREIPGLRKLYKEEGPNGFALLAPAIDNDPSKVGPFARAGHRISRPAHARGHGRLARGRGALRPASRARRQDRPRLSRREGHGLPGRGRAGRAQTLSR